MIVSFDNHHQSVTDRRTDRHARATTLRSGIAERDKTIEISCVGVSITCSDVDTSEHPAAKIARQCRHSRVALFTTATHVDQITSVLRI